jgi:hypothetical protein
MIISRVKSKELWEKPVPVPLHPHKIFRTGALNEPIGVKEAEQSEVHWLQHQTPIPLPYFTLELFLYSEDGGKRFVRNVGNDIPDYTALHFRG